MTPADFGAMSGAEFDAWCERIGLSERIAQGEADYAAGRWYSYDPETDVSTPNPDWPKDGPQP